MRRRSFTKEFKVGAIGAKAGGADIMKATISVTFWGALAMAITAAIGAAFGTTVG